MAFTDNCDIFAAFHEDGFNRILRHIQNQRPSLFNYATKAVADDPNLLCKAINAHPVVQLRGNPLVTLEDPLPIPGTNYGLNFAVQITDLKIDFHPGKKITLPKELDPPLKAQRMAIQLTLCAGIGCPPDDLVNKYIPPPDPPGSKDREQRPSEKQPEIIPLPTRDLHCFCLDVFLVGGVRIRSYYGRPWLEPFADGLEIVDIKPEGLEDSLECYALMLLKLAVLPKLRVLLERAPFELMKNVAVTLKPTPTSPKVPNNPAIEQDQLKGFINVEI